MNKSLSWKFLLPFAIGSWLVGQFLVGGESMFGAGLKLLGTLAFIFAIIALVRDSRKKKSQPE